MYLNFDKIVKREVHPKDLLFLQAVHQQKTEELENVVAMYMEDDSLERFLSDGIVEYIKGKKGDTEIARLRLTKKGRDFLLELQKGEDWTEVEVELVKWGEAVYSKRPNYVKSNKLEAQRRMYWFAQETGITKNELAVLMDCFMKDCFVPEEYDKRPFNEQFGEFKKKNPRAQVSNKLENILWAPKDRFQRHYTLEGSPLWNYYRDNEDYIEKQWERLKK